MKPVWKRFMAASWILGAIAFGCVSSANAAMANPTISLLINGKGVQSDVAPIILNQRMFVPIRVISEHTNAKVTYENATQKIEITQSGREIKLQVGSTQATVNNKSETIDAKPFVYKQRTFVPIRFISQSFGYDVVWDDQAKVAKITRNGRDEAVNYDVENGDSLWKLSQEFEVSIDQIKKANPSINDELLAGSKLTIPAQVNQVKTVGYTQNSYVVQENDSLSSIAKSHLTTEEAIKENNPSLSQYVIVGQIIYLPKGAKDSLHPLENMVYDKQIVTSTYRFPLSAKSEYEPFINTYGDGRSWNPTTQDSARVHEGIDMMTDKGTPVYSVSNGTVNRLGWNTYGGWRVNILDSNGKYHWYYAHLEAYSPALSIGSYVKVGQLLGFVGNTGYGPAGTEGMFESHLHFGMYYHSDGKATNPYYYLKSWEQQKIPTF